MVLTCISRPHLTGLCHAVLTPTPAIAIEKRNQNQRTQIRTLPQIRTLLYGVYLHRAPLNTMSLWYSTLPVVEFKLLPLTMDPILGNY